MQKNNINKSALILVFLLLIPFQDFFLANTILKQFGTNMALIPIYLYYSVLILNNINLKNYKLNKILFYSIIYILSSSLILLNFSNMYIKDTNLVVKMINNIIFYSQPLVVFYSFNYLYKINPTLIKKTITISTFLFLIFTIYLILEYLNIYSLDTNSVIHALNNGNFRPRLFSAESSIGATVLVTYGIISFLYSELYFVRFIFAVLLVLDILIMQSKGTLFIISILFIFSLFDKKNYFISVLLVMIVIIFMYLYLDNIRAYLIGISDGFEAYTSFSTRITMIMAAMISLFTHPLGTGIGSYIQFFDSDITLAKYFSNYFANQLNMNLNFSELDQYFINTHAYSTKTFFFNLIMFAGLPGLYIMYKFYNKIYNKICNKILMILFLFLFLMQSLFVDSVYLYHFWFGFAFIYNYSRSFRCQKKY